MEWPSCRKCAGSRELTSFCLRSSGSDQLARNILNIQRSASCVWSTCAWRGEFFQGRTVRLGSIWRFGRAGAVAVVLLGHLFWSQVTRNYPAKETHVKMRLSLQTHSCRCSHYRFPLLLFGSCQWAKELKKHQRLGK